MRLSLEALGGWPILRVRCEGWGRILEAKQTVDGLDYPVDYTYNPDNSLHTIRYPSQRVVTQTYDAIGRLQQIADPTATYLSGLSYNAAGQALGFTYGNGVAAAFTYNDHLQLATLRYSRNGAPDLLSLKSSAVHSNPNARGFDLGSIRSSGRV